MLSPIERAPASLRPAIGGLHGAGAAAGYHRHAGLADELGRPARQRVLGMVLGRASRAEEGGGGTHGSQRLEAGAQLVFDPLQPVVIGERGYDRRLLGADQLLVERLRHARLGATAVVHDPEPSLLPQENS